MFFIFLFLIFYDTHKNVFGGWLGKYKKNKKLMNSHNKKQKNLVLVEAQTGSGKTYNAVLYALRLAKNGKCAVIALHTKNLVDQTVSQLEDIMSSDKTNQYDKVCLLRHTRNENVSDQVFLKHFITGSLIVVTLHNYYQTIGDSFLHHFLFLMTKLFSFKTYLFIDEGHIYFQNCDRFIPLTHGYFNKYNENHVLKSSRSLKFLSNVEKYEISPPQINYVNPDGGTVYLFESPQKLPFAENVTNVSFLKAQLVNTLIEKNEEPKEIVLAKTKKENSSYVSDLFLNKQIDVSIAEKSYENPYVICNSLKLNTYQNFDESSTFDSFQLLNFQFQFLCDFV